MLQRALLAANSKRGFPQRGGIEFQDDNRSDGELERGAYSVNMKYYNHTPPPTKMVSNVALLPADIHRIKSRAPVLMRDPETSVVDHLGLERALGCSVAAPHLGFVAPSALPLCPTPWVAQLEQVEPAFNALHVENGVGVVQYNAFRQHFLAIGSDAELVRSCQVLHRATRKQRLLLVHHCE